MELNPGLTSGDAQCVYAAKGPKSPHLSQWIPRGGATIVLQIGVTLKEHSCA